MNFECFHLHSYCGRLMHTVGESVITVVLQVVTKVCAWKVGIAKFTFKIPALPSKMYMYIERVYAQDFSGFVPISQASYLVIYLAQYVCCVFNIMYISFIVCEAASCVTAESHWSNLHCCFIA